MPTRNLKSEIRNPKQSQNSKKATFKMLMTKLPNWGASQNWADFDTLPGAMRKTRQTTVRQKTRTSMKNSISPSHTAAGGRLLAALALSLLLVPATVLAQANLLINGDFNTPAGTGMPDGWNNWSWPDWNNAWVDRNGPAGSAFDGTPYMQAGNGNGGNYSVGFYQTVAAAGGLTYALSVECGAQAWWRPEAEMRLIFEDAGGATLAQQVLVTVDPNSWTAYDQGQPWAAFTVSGLAPDNTAQIKAEFVMNGGAVGAWGGGTVWFDNASLQVVPEPGTFGLLLLGLGGLCCRRACRA